MVTYQTSSEKLPIEDEKHNASSIYEIIQSYEFIETRSVLKYMQ